MSRGLTIEESQGLVQEYRIHDNDSGSPEVQIAILSRRIADLTEHVRVHKKDHHTRLGLLKLNERRKRLLKYLEREDYERYKSLVGRLRTAGYRV